MKKFSAITVLSVLALIASSSTALAARNVYNPYNPSTESGYATYYDNPTVGGQGHCAAIHYGRGALLKVTNLKPGSQMYGASIVCRVSDAGPFGPGRVIDLNRQDFNLLSGTKGAGVILVKLELIKSLDDIAIEKTCEDGVVVKAGEDCPVLVEKVEKPTEIDRFGDPWASVADFILAEFFGVE